MPYNGSGVYSLPSGYLAVSGATILASRENSTNEDIKDALNLAFLRDGRAPMSGNLTLVGNASSALHAVPKQQLDAAAQKAPIIGTMTEMKALDTTKYSVAVLNEEGKEGLFIWRSGDYSAEITLDTLSGIYVKANAIASTSGAWVRIFDGSVEAKWFGAVGDNTTDDGDALDAAFDMAMSLGRRLKLSGQAGSLFKRTTQHVWDMAAAATRGVIIEGDGTQDTIIDVKSVATSPQAKIYCSGGTTGSPVIQANAKFIDIGFAGNTTGTVLEIGAHDFSDQLNRTHFDLTVTNDTNSAASKSVEINALYHCTGNINAVHGGTIVSGSIAIRVRKMAFCVMTLGGGNVDTGISLGDDYVYGNVITVPDSEIVNYGGLIDGTHVTENTFIGGTLGYTTYGWQAIAGYKNILQNPNKNSASPILNPDPAFRVGMSIYDGSDIGYNGTVEFGNLYHKNIAMNNTIVSGGTLPAPADGIARTIIWTTAGTAASLTITLPSSPVDGTHVEFYFVNAVTALTVSGGTALGGNPTTVAGKTLLSFTYSTAASGWVAF